MIDVHAANCAIARHQTTFFRWADGQLEPVWPRTCQRFLEVELHTDANDNEGLRGQALVEYLGTGIRWDAVASRYALVHLVTHEDEDDPRPARGYIHILQR